MYQTTTKLIFNQSPRVYGWLYISLIPIFAIIYWVTPSNLTNEFFSFPKSLYFSVVTITTLGYGEIHPITDTGRLLTAIEAFSGVTLIGLFLNSLSRAASTTATANEKKKQEQIYLQGEIAKLLGHARLMQPFMFYYFLGVYKLTNRNEHKPYNENFTLHDLALFDSPIGTLSHSYNTSTIEYYDYQLQLLSSHIASIVTSVDLRLFGSLEEDCIKFVKATHEFEARKTLVFMTKVKPGPKNFGDAVRAAIETYEGEVRFERDSILNPIISLYFQIKIQMETLNKIGTTIEKLTQFPLSKGDIEDYRPRPVQQ